MLTLHSLKQLLPCFAWPSMAPTPLLPRQSHFLCLLHRPPPLGPPILSYRITPRAFSALCPDSSLGNAWPPAAFPITSILIDPITALFSSLIWILILASVQRISSWLSCDHPTFPSSMYLTRIYGMSTMCPFWCQVLKIRWWSKYHFCSPRTDSSVKLEGEDCIRLFKMKGNKTQWKKNMPLFLSPNFFFYGPYFWYHS